MEISIVSRGEPLGREATEMKKRFFSLLMTSVLLAGCGGSAEILPPVSSAPAARVTSGTFLTGQSVPLPLDAGWVEVGLVDADNNRDLIVGMEGQVAVLFGNGDGTFRAPEPIANVTGDVLAVADLNGDGRLDVVATSLFSATFNIIPSNGDGTFGEAIPVVTDGNINEAKAIDFDGDGDQDLAVSLPGVDRLQIFWNNGNLNFTPGPQVTLPYPTGLAVADYNLDGRPDLGVTLYEPHGVAVVLNNAGVELIAAGSGSTASWSYSASPGDFNADGRPDLATLELDNIVSVWTGDGTGGLSAPLQFEVGNESFQVIATNLNGDNHTDFVVANHNETGELDVFIANAEGSFDKRPPSISSPFTISLAAGDVNGDGINDVVCVTGDPNPVVNVFLGQP
jgi:hypothetical protein